MAAAAQPLTSKELNAKWQDKKYIPSVDDLKEYLKLNFGSIPKEELSLWMAMNVQKDWKQTPVTFAKDIVHAMLLFEEKKVYDFLSVAFECAVDGDLIKPDEECDENGRYTGRMVNDAGDAFTWEDVVSQIEDHFANGENGDPILIEMNLV